MDKELLSDQQIYKSLKFSPWRIIMPVGKVLGMGDPGMPTCLLSPPRVLLTLTDSPAHPYLPSCSPLFVQSPFTLLRLCTSPISTPPPPPA